MRRVLTGMFFLLAAFAALSIFMVPESAHAQTLAQLRARLRAARQHHETAAARAKAAALDLEAALAVRAQSQNASDDPAGTTLAPRETVTALLADGIISDDELAALKQTAASKQASADRWAARVRTLKRVVQRRLDIRRWNRSGNWWPLIKIAAKQYKVNPYGLRRLMMLESGGRRYAGTTYRGLFQYHPSTWRASWNPWRRQSIYNGWAQIRATAYAIHRGMGPSQWPHTYPRAF